jgi:hypothetical protein
MCTVLSLPEAGTLAKSEGAKERPATPRAAFLKKSSFFNLYNFFKFVQ